MKRILYVLVPGIIIIFSYFSSCSNSKEQDILNNAESLIETHPDSTLLILKGINPSTLSSAKAKAQYALLMSMALDKNYIDTTSFDILQPAIDYYLKKGNQNEKLRTYYYQGRIFQNRGDRDNALNSFFKGQEIAAECTDSLSIARTLVILAYIYHEFYDFESYTNNHLRAANIYKNLSHKDYEFDCLLNALNGTVLLKDKVRADSIINLCKEFKSLNDTQNKILKSYTISYYLKFGSKQDIKDLISSQYYENSNYDINGILNLALVHHKLGDNDKALKILNYINESGRYYDTLKYQSISVSVLKDIRNYKEALSTYYDFSRRIDSINAIKFKQKSQLLEEKHKIELKAQNDIRTKTRIIVGCIGGIIILIMALFILLLFIRNNRIQKDLSHQKMRNIKLENEKLMAENERMALEAENLSHRIESLENESKTLMNLINTQKELPLEVQNAIQERIEMLNSLLASYITSNIQYEKPYDIWVKKLTDDIENFMNTNRLAFQASHPRFIKYFEEHNLSVNEINYVCLYAIGLRGKEVGNYMKKRSHVNMSSAIRKKLGIDKHETNIGIYVRKLLKNT